MACNGTGNIPARRTRCSAPAKEAITALLGILVHGAEAVRDQRIETFYRNGGIARPKSAVFRRSGKHLDVD
jgi:predicted lipoprotein